MQPRRRRIPQVLPPWQRYPADVVRDRLNSTQLSPTTRWTSPMHRGDPQAPSRGSRGAPSPRCPSPHSSNDGAMDYLTDASAARPAHTHACAQERLCAVTQKGRSASASERARRLRVNQRVSVIRTDSSDGRRCRGPLGLGDVGMNAVGGSIRQKTHRLPTTELGLSRSRIGVSR